jgi:3-methyl-2-oxobutanoate hydroxymethyltransferase
MAERKKLTIHDLQEAKRKGLQLTETFTANPLEAAACEEAGIDMVVTVKRKAEEIRKAAPNVFLVIADDIHSPKINSEAESIRSGFEALELGGDALYTHVSTKWVSAMAREHISVIGHVGYVPYRQSWYGKARAVGKTSTEAMWVYEETLAYQDAGAIGVEMEIVPAKMADEIAKRVQIIIMSMGSGRGGDAQYLFATDILGTNKGHLPRHAKVYADLLEAEKKVHDLRVKALSEFRREVSEGIYPEEKHLIGVKDEELNTFISALEKRPHLP